ncbi:MAG: V-type ATP synthase subunit I, partial [Lachnospiraceae bacterium]|nr:V-type ATP synthase subunit I [Lachnospiraceae bacterium]
MAIVEMRKLSICANKKIRKKILETLQSMGCMEVSTFMPEEEGLTTMDTRAQQAQFEKNAQMFDKALDILDTYAPEKKGFALFTGKEPVTKAS